MVRHVNFQHQAAIELTNDRSALKGRIKWIVVIIKCMFLTVLRTGVIRSCFHEAEIPACISYSLV